jgi:hypothetical protein
MGPKVKAISQFFRATGNRAIICHLEEIEKAVAGGAGTEIIPPAVSRTLQRRLFSLDKQRLFKN